MRTKILASTLVVAAAVAASADTYKLPLGVGAADTVVSEITATDDTDTFSVFLVAGDAIKVTSKHTGPALGLFSFLSLAGPDGLDVPASLAGQGTQKATLSHTAVTTGTYVLKLAGDPGGFAGATGNYRLTFAVKRVKPAAAKFSDAAGGTIATTFAVPAGSTVTISAATKKGGFDLTRLDRPDGSAEPGFAAALKTSKRLKATLSKFPLTGGAGVYTLRGQYDAGSSVSVATKVSTGEKKRTRAVSADEPRLDAGLTPFPSQGVTGTVLHVAGDHLQFEDRTGAPDLVPSFFVGGIKVPPETVTHPNGIIFLFPVPAGLAPNASYDVSVFNDDGQGAVSTSAFFMVPPPDPQSISATAGGPAGGRAIDITGQHLRGGTLVRFGDVNSQATGGGSTITVVSPAHAPGAVSLTLVDEFGQTAPVPGTFTYLDVPSNRIDSVSPSLIQGIGGEAVTVTGVNFGTDSVFTFGGADVGAVRESATRYTFTAPEHAEAIVELKVVDQYGQTSILPVRTGGFTNVTDTSIPAPVTTAGSAEGWRATRVLAADLNGDNKQDLVLLRPEQAFGDDANRSRIRLLINDGNGGFADVSATNLPPVSGDEDWRAKDGVIALLDNNSSPDIAIITDEPVAGGTRSSLRILFNNGSGTFTDGTAAAVPTPTTYGDRNQGVCIAAANVDGQPGTDLVILHTDYFTQTVVTPGDPPPEGEPPPPDTVEYFYFPGTRVLVNSGTGAFSRKAAALPAVTPTSLTQYQGNALAVGDADGGNGPDIVITKFAPSEDPAQPGTFLRAARFLANGGTGTFTDASAATLPAASDPEYLQGDRIVFSDIDADGDLDLVLTQVSPLVSPITAEVAATSAARLFANDGTGVYSPATSRLPDTDASDRNQASRALVADLTGDGKPEIAFFSYLPPVVGERAARLYAGTASGSWRRALLPFPAPNEGDDFRAVDAVPVDVDGDGALDIVLVRDEATNAVRSTLVLLNPR